MNVDGKSLSDECGYGEGYGSGYGVGDGAASGGGDGGDEEDCECFERKDKEE